jgi:predicted transposase YdaD
MGKSKNETSTVEQQQPYDNILKSLLEGQEAQILPYLLDEEVVYLDTLTIEVMRTLLRTDRVYKVLYRGREHILHLEFETDGKNFMDSRLLDYHAYFYHKYHLPVISIIVYPFETTMAQSPLQELSGDEVILFFRFRVFPLWRVSAQKYVQEHIVPMYALLPAMQGANAQLVCHAIEEMVQYYQYDDAALAREVRWMGIMTRRADIIPLEEKRIIEERLSMFDDLMEKDPKMRRIRAESEARGRAEGEAKGVTKGVTKGLQGSILILIETRFPALVGLGRQRVKALTKADELNELLKQLLLVSDEEDARSLLTSQF